jgi:hypothetical protein
MVGAVRARHKARCQGENLLHNILCVRKRRESPFIFLKFDGSCTGTVF